MATYSSTQLVDAMKKRVSKFVKKDVPQAGAVAGEIYGNMKYNPDKYREGMVLRGMRGGFGDALLNTDRPPTKLVGEQMGQVQKAAFKDNMKAVTTAAAAPSIVAHAAKGMTTMAAKKALQSRATGKFVSGNMFKRFAGKLAGK